MLLTSLLLFLVFSLLLVVSGGYLVKLILKIASFLKLSDFVVAFIIMAFSTSIPELFIGISSAIKGNPALSLGNVIGSNIADVSIIIGIAALVRRGVRTKNPFIKKDSLFMFLIAMIPILLMLFDKTLSRIDGTILIIIFLFYVGHLFRERRQIENKLDQKSINNRNNNNNNNQNIVITVILFVVCLGILFLSSHFVVEYATQLAIDLFLPPILIGLFLLALGTSLPELIFEMRAVLARKGDLALGDAMGSVVCNSTLVLGITAIISPITNGFLLFVTSAIFMIFILFLFMALIKSKKGLSIRGAITLILMYIFFILFEFYFKSKY
ncbi:sodium:calcium antiporter [Candidatus Woesearchaeota archaeon]|nr:sodium:calcium antiporter [Candidatus Woesearchaeota archaeon]